MNLIFLDIDGVLNSHKFGRRKLTIEEEQRQIEKLDPHNVAILNALCVAADAYIVITSTWRTHGPAKIGEWLQQRGLGINRVIACLPNHLPRGWVKWEAQFGPKRSRFFRGLEIEAWLLRQGRVALDRIKFVIIDDDGDMGRLRPFWVRTTMFEGPETLDPVKYNYTGPYSGLQAEHVGQAVLKATEMPTADVLLAEPNEHWTDEAKGVLYPSLTGYSPRGHDSAFSG